VIPVATDDRTLPAGETRATSDDRTVTCAPAGKRIRFVETAAETDGERTRFEMWLDAPPNSHGPMLHVHPAQDEDLEVVTGRLGVRVREPTADGGHRFERYALGPGESITVPKGVPHRFWNAGTEELHLTGEVRPALRTETFMRVTYGLAEHGHSTPSGMPLNPLRLAVVLDRFDDLLWLALLPLWLQQFGVRLLAPVGRLLGYPSEYPQYESPDRR
jgi:mannose-6-phosphate isomerase-like protein (cupin superfamily)